MRTGKTLRRVKETSKGLMQQGKAPLLQVRITEIQARQEELPTEGRLLPGKQAAFYFPKPSMSSGMKESEAETREKAEPPGDFRRFCKGFCVNGFSFGFCFCFPSL